MRQVTCALAVVTIVCVFSALVALAQPEKLEAGLPPPPPVRSIPGLTAEDPHPNGCVDCHVYMKEYNKDVRISTMMAQWTSGAEPKLVSAAKAAAANPARITGKHPVVKAALKNIPRGCLTCHRSDSKTAPPFARMMHVIHLVGGDQNPYMGYYQGDCTHCHKLDAKTGSWSIHSAPEPAPGD